MDDDRPLHESGADEVEAHHQSAQHNDGNHRIDEHGKELLAGIVNALRRQALASPLQNQLQSDPKPASVVVVEGHFFFEHFSGQVSSESEDPVGQKDDDPSESDGNVKLQ